MQGKNILVDILNENKNKIVIAGANILFLFALIYVFALIVRSEYIETERAELEIRRDIMDFTAYIFRNEEIIYADSSGTGAAYLVENGDKVAKNQAVAHINRSIASDSSDFVKAEIEALEKRIDILKKSNINLEYAAASIEKVNNDSNDLYIEMLKSIKYNKMEDTDKNRDEMLILLNKKQLIIRDAENFNGIINSLSERKRELEFDWAASSAANFNTPVSSHRSGIFYKKPDGYENYFTGDTAKTLDLAKFNELMKVESDANIINRAVGKVAYDYNWYFVCKTNEKDFADGIVSFKESTNYNIICPYSSNRVIPSKLISQIKEYSSDEILLVFETTVSPADFDFLRKQTVQIVSREVRGIKVPDSAVKLRELRQSWEEDENGVMQEFTQIIDRTELTESEAVSGEMVKGVYVLQGSEIKFRTLDEKDKIAEFDGYSLYTESVLRPEGSKTTLQDYEDIIIAGKDLYHGKVISK